MHAVIKSILDMQISKRNVISIDGKFWTLDEIFQWKGIMADKKQFSNTKSIVKVETGIVTLILYHH